MKFQAEVLVKINIEANDVKKAKELLKKHKVWVDTFGVDDSGIYSIKVGTQRTISVNEKVKI